MSEIVAIGNYVIKCLKCGTETRIDDIFDDDIETLATIDIKYLTDNNLCIILDVEDKEIRVSTKK